MVEVRFRPAGFILLKVSFPSEASWRIKFYAKLCQLALALSGLTFQSLPRSDLLEFPRY